MNRFGRLPSVGAVVTALTVVGASPASAGPRPPDQGTRLVMGFPLVAGPPADGATCGFVSVTDPTIENGEVQTGVVFGGPVVNVDYTISLRCTVQVGAANATHSGAASVEQPNTGPRVAAVGPTLASYSAPEGQPVYVCTEVWLGSPFNRRYWDASSGFWSASASATCQEAISQEAYPGPAGPIIDWVDQLVVDFVDPVLCQILGFFSLDFPGIVGIAPDGDVNILGEPFWACPPY